MNGLKLKWGYATAILVHILITGVVSIAALGLVFTFFTFNYGPHIRQLPSMLNGLACPAIAWIGLVRAIKSAGAGDLKMPIKILIFSSGITAFLAALYIILWTDLT